KKGRAGPKGGRARPRRRLANFCNSPRVRTRRGSVRAKSRLNFLLDRLALPGYFAATAKNPRLSRPAITRRALHEFNPFTPPERRNAGIASAAEFPVGPVRRVQPHVAQRCGVVSTR